MWELSERILGVRKKNKRIVVLRNEIKRFSNQGRMHGLHGSQMTHFRMKRRIREMPCSETK